MSKDFITDSDMPAIQQVDNFMSNFMYNSFVTYVTFSYIINGKKVLSQVSHVS